MAFKLDSSWWLQGPLGSIDSKASISGGWALQPWEGCWVINVVFGPPPQTKKQFMEAMKLVRELEVGEVWWMLQTHFMDHFVRSCSDNLHHLWTWTWQLLSQWLLFIVPSPEFDVDMLFDAGFASKFYKLNEQMTTSMSWSFPLLARQVIHAADPPRSNPSWASQGVVTWEQNIARLCDKWCEKKRCCVWCGRDAWKHKGSHNILEQNDSFSFTLSQHFRNEHRPIQHAAQGSQGGSNGLMIYAGMTHLCLEGSEPGL